MKFADLVKLGLLAGGVAATGGLAAAPLAAGAAGAGAAGTGLLGAGAATGAASTAGAGGLLGSVGTGLGELGAAGAYGTSLGSQQTAMLAAQEAGMGTTGSNLFAGLKSAGEYIKPASQALGAASQVQSMIPQEQPIQGSAPPPMQTGGLSELYQSLQNQDGQRMEADLQARMRQQELLKRFGGGYGIA